MSGKYICLGCEEQGKLPGERFKTTADAAGQAAMEEHVREAHPPVRFGIAVDGANGHHVRFRLFAATGGQHLGGCGSLVMTAAEYAKFRQLLEPRLTDRSDPPGP